jgi:5'-3' exonuclease
MDASMALYSFMVAIRPDANFTLADESGEATSHLNGIFYRTIRMMKHGKQGGARFCHFTVAESCILNRFEAYLGV